MKDIVTTTIRLERRKLMELKRRALEHGVSLSALVRSILDGDPTASSGRPGKAEIVSSQRRAIRPWAGTSLGDGFSGRDHDEVLYGRGK